MPADDARSGGNAVIVLSDKGWDRHFNRDPNVLGRTVLVNGAPFEIVGVTAAGFRGLEVGAPRLLGAVVAARRSSVPADRGREDSVGVEIVGRLRPGVSRESARAQLAAWDSNRSADTRDRRSTTIDLLPRRGTIPQPLEAIAVFAPLFVAFGLILMIGCANVANLLLARGVARQREIGIRLSLGASRRRIVRQLMTESVLLALAAAAGGYLISRLALEGAVYWVLRTMPVDLGDVNLNVPAADWRVAVFLVVAAVAATGFFALMPALHATAIDPVRTLRGELVKDARPGRARNALIGVQVFASALLLICAADLSAQRDRLCSIRSGFPHRRYGVDRHQQRAEARSDDPGGGERRDDHRIRCGQAAVARPVARCLCRHRRRQDARWCSSPFRDRTSMCSAFPIVRGRAFMPCGTRRSSGGDRLRIRGARVVARWRGRGRDASGSNRMPASRRPAGS